MKIPSGLQNTKTESLLGPLSASPSSIPCIIAFFSAGEAKLFFRDCETNGVRSVILSTSSISSVIGTSTLEIPFGGTIWDATTGPQLNECVLSSHKSPQEGEKFEGKKKGGKDNNHKKKSKSTNKIKSTIKSKRKRGVVSWSSSFFLYALGSLRFPAPKFCFSFAHSFFFFFLPQNLRVVLKLKQPQLEIKEKRTAYAPY